MSKTMLTPSRSGNSTTNGNHNRIATNDNVRLSALTDFAGSKLSGPAIAKKYSIDTSSVYAWSKSPEIYESLGFSEKSFSHRRMVKRVKKEAKKKKPSMTLDQQIGPVSFCPNCCCDIRAVAIAMKMSS